MVSQHQRVANQYQGVVNESHRMKLVNQGQRGIYRMASQNHKECVAGQDQKEGSRVVGESVKLARLVKRLGGRLSCGDAIV